jgi:hypothetical protein
MSNNQNSLRNPSASGLSQNAKGQAKKMGPNIENPTDQATKSDNTSIADLISPEQAFTADGSKFISDSFLNWASLDGDDYRKLYGYEFVIFDAHSNNAVIKRLAMPLAPQDIQIEVPNAVSTTVTMKGIVEEHGGSPLRTIVISGTTGVLPVQEYPSTKGTRNNGILDYLFRNTIQQFSGLSRQIKRTIASATGSEQSTVGPLNYSKTTAANTGYYFLHKLDRFFAFYMAKKKTKEGHHWRMAFNMYKDQMYYDVTVERLAYSKQAGTLENFYNIRLLAWKRRTNPVGERGKPKELAPSKADKLNALARIINTLKNARRVVARSYGLMSGIRADINDSLITPIREVLLLGKDLRELAFDMYDFGFSSTNSFWAGAKESFLAALDQFSQKSRRDAINDTIASKGLFGQGIAGTLGGGALAASYQVAQGNGTAALTINESTVADPLDNIFNNPINYPEIFEGILIDDLPLSDQAFSQITNEIQRIRALDSNDLRRRRDLMVSYTASISEALGGGSSEYNAARGISTKKVFKKLTTEDIELLSALNDIQMATDSIIAIVENLEGDTDDDYYSFYEKYAISQGLRFNQNASKFLVPFPLGASLEQLAYQYLGSPDRWIEIAALNGLKSPYIDEIGREVFFKGSGAGNSFTVPSDEGLYINQLVTIYSDTETATTRRIKTVQVLSAAETLVEVDGPSDIGKYKLIDKARMRVYAPDTVNSSMLIAIPSDQPVSVPGKIKTSVGIEDLNGLAQLAKVDLMLDSTGDIVMGPDDVKLSVGLTNLVQAANLKLQTAVGSLLQHPTYGNPVQAGSPTSEVDTSAALNAIRQAFGQDPRFSGIQAAEIKKNGPAVEIKILVGVSNTDINLPLSARVPY